MRNMLYILCFTLLCGCQITPPKTSNGTGQTQSLSATVDNVTKRVDDISVANKEIVASATKINKDSLSVTADNYVDFLTRLRSETQNILGMSKSIDLSLARINEDKEKFAQNVKQIEELQQKVASLESQNAEAKQDAIKDLYSNMKYIFGLGSLSLVIGACVFFLVDKKLGIVIAAIGILTLGLAAGAIYYMKAIALVGIGILISGLLLTAGIVVRYLVKQTQEVDRSANAVAENVMLIENIKQVLPEDVKRQIFGAEQGLASKIQSQETKDIVSTIRSEIKGNT